MKIPWANESSQETASVTSCLNLQPVFRWRQDCKCRRIATNHCDFIAAIEPRTLITIFVDLVGKILMVSGGESQTREEFRNSGEQAYATDFVLFRLRQQSLDQTPTAAAALAGRIDGNGTNLGKMHTVEMKGAASDDAVVLLEHDKVAHVLADLRQRARQQSAVAGVGRD